MSSLEMVTDRQREIIENWEQATKNDKKEVREKLSKHLQGLLYLSELPPEVSQNIVKESIEGIPDDNLLSFQGIERDKKAICRNEMLFAAHVIANLFNGVGAIPFEEGVADGVNGAIRWWDRANYPRGETMYKGLQMEWNSNSPILTEEEEELYGLDPKDPPETEDERLRRIFRFWGAPYFDDDVFVTFLRFNNSVSFGKYEFEIEDTEDREVDIMQRRPSDGWLSDEYVPREEQYKERYLEVAHEIILNSRNQAEILAHSINHPTNSVFPDFPLPESTKRELLELHRDHLQQEGIFPDEEELPQYSNEEPSIPYPPLLDLPNWTWSDPTSSK